MHHWQTTAGEREVHGDFSLDCCVCAVSASVGERALVARGSREMKGDEQPTPR